MKNKNLVVDEDKRSLTFCDDISIRRPPFSQYFMDNAKIINQIDDMASRMNRTLDRRDTYIRDNLVGI